MPTDGLHPVRPFAAWKTIGDWPAADGGPIVRVSVGREGFYLVCDPEAIGRVLVGDEQCLAVTLHPWSLHMAVRHRERRLGVNLVPPDS